MESRSAERVDAGWQVLIEIEGMLDEEINRLLKHEENT
jgi:hypothetical protein